MRKANPPWRPIVVLMTVLFSAGPLQAGAGDTRAQVPKERPTINAIGVLSSAPDRTQSSLTLESFSAPTVYIPGTIPGSGIPGIPSRDLSLGQELAGAVAFGILEGLIRAGRQLEIEQRIEQQIDSELARALGDWSFARIFNTTFTQVLAESGHLAVRGLDISPSSGDLKSVVNSALSFSLRATKPCCPLSQGSPSTGSTSVSLPLEPQLSGILRCETSHVVGLTHPGAAGIVYTQTCSRGSTRIYGSEVLVSQAYVRLLTTADSC